MRRPLFLGVEENKKEDSKKSLTPYKRVISLQKLPSEVSNSIFEES